MSTVLSPFYILHRISFTRYWLRMEFTTPIALNTLHAHKDCWQQVSITLDNQQIATLLAQLEYAVLLDSGSDLQRGNFDILTGQPAHFVRIDKQAACEHASQSSGHLSDHQQTIPVEFRSLPFVCGQIAYCSYEYGAAAIIDGAHSFNTSTLPWMFCGYYSWSYVYNRRSHQGTITFSAACPLTTRQQVLSLIQYRPDTQSRHSYSPPRWTKCISYQQYLDRFNQIKAYINAGDCYQVNLAQRFEADFTGLPCQLFFDLRKTLNTPYSAYLSFAPEQTLLCFSPEQFIGIRDKRVITKPIKGTIANSENNSNPETLVNSAKNQAENLMIVDLLRNDLSKVCQLNSVRVSELFKLESYQNVHHLVSTIEGHLKTGVSEQEAFFACFPGGSITGAPKKRAMEIINELEDSGRDAYCGSIYYRNDNGHFNSNILIRSIVHSGDKLYCWGGGGIVHDSTAEEEYLESLTKVANLTGIFE